jgi:hypothetical protein
MQRLLVRCIVRSRPGQSDASQEFIMITLASLTTNRPLLHFHPMPVECLPRDKTQSLLLHEPKYRLSNIDPMSGEDISDVKNHPSVVDGNLTIYFQTDQTRQDYIDMPVNHPSLHLPFEASIEDDRGG